MRGLLHLKPHHRLLDVGGGTGVYADLFASDGSGFVILEPHGGRLAYGRVRRPRMHFVQGSAENLPFPDGRFDRVVAAFSLHHMPRQDDALAEMARVIREGGRLVVEEFDPAAPPTPFLHLFQNKVRGENLALLSPVELQECLVGHGFRDVIVEPGRRGYFAVASL